MKTIRKIVVGGLMLVGTLNLNYLLAQEPMGLQQCIDYAADNNLAVKESQLGVSEQKVLQNRALMNRLPAVGASLQNSQSWGSYAQEDWWVKTSNNNSRLEVNADVTLFNGFKLANAQQKLAFDVAAAGVNRDIVIDNISIEVASAFLQVLYYSELERMYEIQLKTVQEELTITTVKYESGALARESLLEIRSELVRQNATLVEAKTGKVSALVALQQKINFKESGFIIAEPKLPEVTANVSLQAAEEVFGMALPQRPEIKWADLQLASSGVALKMAKADYYPSLRMFAGYGDYYNDTNPIVFKEQIKVNESKSVGVRLSIPIFNRHEARNNVKLAELAIKRDELQLEMQKKNLRESIQNAWTRAVNAREKYISKRSVLSESQELFRLAEEKFRLGALAALELNIQRNRLLVAEVDLLQSKHEFIFATKVLEFYAGLPLVL